MFLSFLYVIIIIYFNIRFCFCFLIHEKKGVRLVVMLQYYMVIQFACIYLIAKVLFVFFVCFLQAYDPKELLVKII